MENMLHVSSSPHVRSKHDTADIMRDVCIALLPTTLFGAFYFGLYSLLVVILCVASCVLSEYVYEKLMHKPITIKDFSAVVTGMILGLNMPPQIKWWVPVLGGIFAIIVVKQLYGGLGQNFMNPALAARCFLLISFAGLMNNYSCAHIGFDAVTSATPLAALDLNRNAYSLGQLFLGTIPGTIGEVSKICLLLGAAYLLWKKVITLRIPGIYIATAFVFSFIFGDHNVMSALKEVMAGGLIFGAFFMATDYVTTPVTPKGHVIYGIILGLLNGLFRSFGASSEGCSYAILLGNLLVPLIDRLSIPVPFGYKNAKKEGK